MKGKATEREAYKICRGLLERCYQGRRTDFIQQLLDRQARGLPTLVVTANPECLAYAVAHEDYHALLCRPETELVADGVGLLRMAALLGRRPEERIPGVELLPELLDRASAGRRVALLGAKPEVLRALEEVFHQRWPQHKLVFSVDGYQPEREALMAQVQESRPDFLFVALGMPEQERLIARHIAGLPACVAVGVGGSFDVLSGHKKRAPRIFTRLGLEWLYRILAEPQRLGRFWRNNVQIYRHWRRQHRRYAQDYSPSRQA